MIKSKSLLNILQATLDKEDIVEEDLDRIEDLTLNRYKLNGLENDIDLKELKLFKNLKTLTLINFAINIEDVERINKIEPLWAVQFSRCSFEGAVPINTKVKYLIIDYCKYINYELINNNRTVRIIGAEVDLSSIKQSDEIERLFLQDCDIKNADELAKFSTLKYLNLDGSKIDNDVLNNLNKDIKLSHKKEYHPEEG